MSMSSERMQPAPAKIALVALDLDGTTLNSSHTLSSKTLSTLKRLSEKGVNIAIATGRCAPATHKHIQDLALEADVPTVCYNGCCGITQRYSAEGGISAEPIFKRVVEEQKCKELIKFAVKHGFVVQYYDILTGDIYALNKRNDTHASLLSRYSGLVQMTQIEAQILNPTTSEVCDDTLGEFLSRIPAAKILVLHADADELLALARAHFAEDMFSVIKGSPHPFFVEFLPHGVTKGDGLRALCESFSPPIPLSEVAAFGDGQNDVEFLRLAGYGVAVQNAVAEAKQVADVVLERSHDEDAVALHLEFLENCGCFN